MVKFSRTAVKPSRTAVKPSSQQDRGDGFREKRHSADVQVRAPETPGTALRDRDETLM